MTITENLLCCDWGTSSFRLRLVDTSSLSIIAEYQSSDGVASTFKEWQSEGSVNRFDFYSSRLTSAISLLSKKTNLPLEGTPIIISGMASSSIGMEEIAYASLPFPLDGSGVSSAVFPDFNGKGSHMVLVSGVRSQHDVMRGEEAQLMGLFQLPETNSLNSSDSIFIFPGTHSKHMVVKNGLMTAFSTFMTGEMFNILSEFSILKDSIAGGGDIMADGNRSAFVSGVLASGSSSLLNALFATRTNQLFSILSKEQNAFYLSGLLIGNELRELGGRSFSQLIVCSGKHLYNPYQIACQALKLTENVVFIQPELIDKATIAGQIQIFRALDINYE